MSHSLPQADSLPEARPSQAIAAARIAIGLLQGLAVYGLIRLVDGDEPAAWVLRNPKGFALTFLLVGALPLPLLLGLGHLRAKVLACWVVLAGLVILGLGLHDLRQNGVAPLPVFSPQLFICLPPLLFIAHALVSAADASRHWWPRYEACFEAAWRATLQLLLGGLFLGAFWMVFRLGAALFSIIGIDALERLIERPLFHIVVTGGVGAAALHLADAQDRLTRGARMLGLNLQSWLAPLLAGVTGAFLLALPFTGLQPLWDTRHAGVLLLVTAAVLVMLVNAIHQDGHHREPAVLTWSARLAAIELPLLVGLAGWGIWLRIAQYGLTPPRVLAVAVLVVLAAYAITYPFAARRPGMPVLEPANIGIAGLIVVVLLALNTPLADPARLAVSHQVGRLLAGKVSPEAFDTRFLRRDAGRYGRDALAALGGNPNAAFAALATRPDATPGKPGLAETPLRLVTLPADAALPDAVRALVADIRIYCRQQECTALPVDMAGDGRRGWLIGPMGIAFRLYEEQGGTWRRSGEVSVSGCGAANIQAIREGRFSLAPARTRDILVGDQRLRMGARSGCEAD